MINENTIYTTTEICWAVENDDLCDGYGCAPMLNRILRRIHSAISLKELRRINMNPFTALIDWIDESADFMAPVGAFIGVGIAIALCFINGGN